MLTASSFILIFILPEPPSSPARSTASAWPMPRNRFDPRGRSTTTASSAWWANGAGKSTLLRLIAGVLLRSRHRARPRPLGGLPATGADPRGAPWRRFTTCPRSPSGGGDTAVEERLADLAARRARPAPLARQERLIEEFAALGGPAYEARACHVARHGVLRRRPGVACRGLERRAKLVGLPGCSSTGRLLSSTSRTIT